MQAAQTQVCIPCSPPALIPAPVGVLGSRESPTGVRSSRVLPLWGRRSQRSTGQWTEPSPEAWESWGLLLLPRAQAPRRLMQLSKSPGCSIDKHRSWPGAYSSCIHSNSPPQLVSLPTLSDCSGASWKSSLLTFPDLSGWLARQAPHLPALVLGPQKSLPPGHCRLEQGSHFTSPQALSSSLSSHPPILSRAFYFGTTHRTGLGWPVPAGTSEASVPAPSPS